MTQPDPSIITVVPCNCGQHVTFYTHERVQNIPMIRVQHGDDVDGSLITALAELAPAGFNVLDTNLLRWQRKVHNEPTTL